jgi:hypothetical protein
MQECRSGRFTEDNTVTMGNSSAKNITYLLKRRSTMLQGVITDGKVEVVNWSLRETCRPA